ncbi:MAG: pantoate--beta-alanine ligase [Bacteroidota bacterium]
MKIFSDPNEIKNELKQFENVSVGFVPTMGALHEGHLSLVERSKKENEITVVSIFINPTQFDNKGDLENYPSLLKEDLKLLKKYEVDYIFTPDYNSLYPDDFKYKVDEDEFSHKLCGKSRDGHFTGVLTVVMKLLNIIRPNRVYFGEKDRQQLQLIKNMTEAFFINVIIVSVPTVREDDGLAMSSRNIRLSKEERQIAGLFPKLLKTNSSDVEITEQLNNNGFKTDYIETLNGIRYGAVFLGNVRLIDNVEL